MAAASSRKSHRQHIEDKQADIARPTPTPLTVSLIQENTLEACEKVRRLEMLFISLSDMPGLAKCCKLQELTIMHARL